MVRLGERRAAGYGRVYAGGFCRALTPIALADATGAFKVANPIHDLLIQ